MKNILIEFLAKFILHSTIFGILLYFLNDLTIEKTVLTASSFGLMLALFNMYQNHKKTSKMDINKAQLDVDNWIKNHGVRYFNELTNMAQLTEEVGEVARIIARRYGEQSEKESDKNKDLGEELADVVFVVLCLANQTGIKLQDAFDKKLDLKTNRDHDRHQNNEKLK